MLDMPAPEEPQEDDGGGGDDLGADLLARARLLCQAANEIALPMLQSVHKIAERHPSSSASRPSTRDEGDHRGTDARSKQTSRLKSCKRGKGELALPQPAPPILPPLLEEKRVTKTKTPNTKNTGNNQEESGLGLPQINASEEWRKQREIEKIRHAQERAKARVFRKTALNAPTSNLQRGTDSETCTNELRNETQAEYEANRRRAQERIHLRKVQNVPPQVPEQTCAKTHNDTLNKKKSFHYQTVQRLQEARHEIQTKIEADVTDQALLDGPEHQVDQTVIERDRNRQEKLRRKETAERVKRQRQLAEDQQRMDREFYEKGLNEFKAKKREQDLVAKGQPTRRLVAGDPHVDVSRAHKESEELRLVDCAGFGSRNVQPTPTIPEDHLADNVDHESGTREEVEMKADQENQLMSIHQRESVDTSVVDESMQPPSSKVRSHQKKKPSWKKSPVPIRPTESFTSKATVSLCDSYGQKFRLRKDKTSPVPASRSPKLPRAPTSTNESSDQLSALQDGPVSIGKMRL